MSASFLPSGLFAFSLLAGATLFAAAPERIWPDRPPGEDAVRARPAPVVEPGPPIAGRPVSLQRNIADPTFTLYRPAPERDTGAAVVVLPGGGYYVLAIDLEGTEICAWLNELGLTAILLEYRVPRTNDVTPQDRPLQDAQRALGLVRSEAERFGVDPHRIGVIGFSAGGHLAAVLANAPEPRTYAAVDNADRVSCRPDFCLILYPGYLTGPAHGDTLSPEVVPSAHTPPTFLAMAADDGIGVQGITLYYLALQRAGVAAELHLYPRGGHGYGLRRTKDNVTAWPDRAAEWLRAEGFLRAAP